MVIDEVLFVLHSIFPSYCAFFKPFFPIFSDLEISNLLQEDGNLTTDRNSLAK
jgi:hypothetical protein